VEEQNRFDRFDALDFVNLALSPIPSKFGRLVALADMRDHNNDQLADMLYGKEQIDDALQQQHCEIFFAWLGLGLAAKMADVAEYLATEGGTDTAITKLVQRWVQDKLHERLRPAMVGESDWELFSSELETILQLLTPRLGFSGGSRRD
jgi:hypothetical protein